MKPKSKIILISGIIAPLCLGIAYGLAFQYSTRRTAVIRREPAKKEVLWTGVILTTNGWEFKLFNLIDFGKRSACPIVFCEKTRQLFIGFDEMENRAGKPFYQWDIDTGKCVQTFHAGNGFNQWVEAVSPDGKNLIVTKRAVEGSVGKSVIMDLEKRSITADLGDLGALYECRFSPDSKRVWLQTGARWNSPLVYKMDGTPVNTFSAEDFPKKQDSRIWNVPVSKDPKAKTGLVFKDSSGATHLLATDCWGQNYWISKDSRIIVAAGQHEEIIIWDALTAKELVRQRITSDHNGGGFIIYDEAKDRFLIADPSYQGTTHLRALVVTKKPQTIPQLAN